MCTGTAAEAAPEAIRQPHRAVAAKLRYERRVEPDATSYFAELGGEQPLRRIIHEFVERIVNDMMIGFFFARVNRERLERLEYEHAAVFLGGDVTYSGRDIADAHARHPILEGHFARRRLLLKQTLERHHVPAPIVAAWLAHQDTLRPLVMHAAARKNEP